MIFYHYFVHYLMELSLLLYPQPTLESPIHLFLDLTTRFLVPRTDRVTRLLVASPSNPHLSSHQYFTSIDRLPRLRNINNACLCELLD